MQQNLQQKKGLVKSVFDTVYNKYDLMNDFMSLGVHRYWKKELIRQINPSSNDTLVDVACGTGDIAKLFSDVNQNRSKIIHKKSAKLSKFIEILTKYFKRGKLDLDYNSNDTREFEWYNFIKKKKGFFC